MAEKKMVRVEMIQTVSVFIDIEVDINKDRDTMIDNAISEYNNRNKDNNICDSEYITGDYNERYIDEEHKCDWEIKNKEEDN